MKLYRFLQMLSAYPNMEVLVYDPRRNKAVDLNVALRTTKRGVELEPPALIIYPVLDPNFEPDKPKLVDAYGRPLLS